MGPVKNAGIFLPQASTDYTEDDYYLVMNAKVASFLFTTQQVIPPMRKQRSGHVVNILTVLADQPSGGEATLNALAAAQEHLGGLGRLKKLVKLRSKQPKRRVVR